MKNILLIVNPVSGKQKIQSKEKEIVQILNSDENSVSCVATEYRGHAEMMAENALADGFDTIVCCGGDGTLNEIFTGLLRSGTNDRVQVGYLPCGSTNDFAKTLGLDLNPIGETKNILSQQLKSMDVGMFGEDKYFSYIASFGALTDASYSAPQSLKNRVGHFAYILEGIKDFFKIKPVPAVITVDGEEFSGYWAFGSCSNTMSVAGLVTLDESIVDLGDGLFEVILVRYPKNAADLAKILWGATHSDFESELFVFKKAKTVTMEFFEDVPFTLDGEMAMAHKKVEINNLAKAVQLYV